MFTLMFQITFVEMKCQNMGEIMFHCHLLLFIMLLFSHLAQWFLNLSWGPPTTAYSVCLPHLTHLIQLISSLVESARLELGVAYERDIQNMWWLGVPRTGLRTTDLADAFIQSDLQMRTTEAINCSIKTTKNRSKTKS